MKKYEKIAFNDSIKLINYFNDPKNSNKELLSVCAIAPTLCDTTFVVFYRNKRE